MKHLKKFENSSSQKFELSEIADIINEFADAFDIEEVDDIIIYPDINSYGGMNSNDPCTFLSELKEIDHGIETSFKICLPYDYIDDNFSDLCETNIEIFKTLKSLDGKMETFNVEILSEHFWIDFDMNKYPDISPYSIILSLQKI